MAIVVGLGGSLAVAPAAQAADPNDSVADAPAEVTATPEPLVTTAPDVTPGPPVTTAPDVTPEPRVTTAPDVTPGPLVTTAPDEGGIQPFAGESELALGNLVWLDEDGDGVQDAGEPGIAGVTLTLALSGAEGAPVIDAYGEEVFPATTDGDGFYYFGGLSPLNPGEFYIVTIDPDSPPLAVYDATTTGAGDSQTDSSTGSAEASDFVDGFDGSLDFGFVLKPVAEPKSKVSVGDRVWLDTDNDGLQDAGEPGLAGVRLTLTGPDGESVTDVFDTPVQPITTGTSGAYSFTNLPALPAGQHYTVRALPPAGYMPTAPDVGDDRGLDSSMDAGTSGDVEVDGARDATLDFGFIAPQDDDDTGTDVPSGTVKPSVYVGNFVWRDVNKNGLQDDGETGIAGVRMTLTRSNGTSVIDVYGKPVAPRLTDKDGYYVFGDLPLGSAYTVTIDSQSPALANYIPTIAGVGDRWYNSSTKSATSLTLATNSDYDYTLDFGFVVSPPKLRVSVGDFVWLDSNRNGRQDTGEPGIPGVRLTVVGPDGKAVTDVNGITVGAVTTDAGGKYSFNNLRALAAGKHYTVKIDTTSPALAKYTPTTAGVGTAAGNSSTGSAASSDLVANGARDATLDFGYLPPKPSVSVGDLVWVDSNKNGRQDVGERGLAGVRMTLVGPDGLAVKNVDGTVVGVATTNANGQYSFAKLPPLPAGKHYKVKLDSTSPILAYYTPTTAGVGDAAGNSSTGAAVSVNLVTTGARDATLDFGFVPRPSVSVGDRVWVDSNRNGRQDAGEPGLAGVRLTLVGPNGAATTNVGGAAVGAVTTNATGGYSFSWLRPLAAGQRYTVKIDTTSPALGLYRPTTAGVGDAAGNSSTGSAASTTLTASGARDATLDFGYVLKAAVAVGNHVWVDSNKNGRQDAGEPPLAGVRVTLVGPDGLPVKNVAGKVLGPFTTKSLGNYSFSSLPPLPAGKHYTVKIDATSPVLAKYTPTKAGVGDAAGNSSTGSAVSVDLVTSGARDSTLDFGFIPKPLSDEPVTVPSPAATPEPATSPTVAPVPVPSATPPAGALAVTGMSDQPGWAGGVMLLTLGILILAALRRRSHPNEQG